jgi:hypothetical protein
MKVFWPLHHRFCIIVGVLSMHVAPFRHGVEEHSFRSTWQLPGLHVLHVNGQKLEIFTPLIT